MVAISVSVLCAKYSYQGDVVLGWTLWGNCASLKTSVTWEWAVIYHSGDSK